ncbi:MULTISPECIES: PIN-like domain-containing protein [Acetobacteraceae]|uniref:PIN-like domain-containing protein n=1 Tax=Acetobacteraceae TaxID=433 RepID=UPI00345C42FD|nr:hypothetical protein [Acidomonas methanolica]
MRVFFDNCTSPVLARTLNGFVQHLGHSVDHIADLPCGRHASDLEWISMLGESSDVWIVMTGDGRIYKNKPEREAFRRANLRGFVFAPAYQKTPLHQTASVLIWRWPDLEQLISRISGAALFEIPINRSSGVKSLPL